VRRARRKAVVLLTDAIPAQAGLAVATLEVQGADETRLPVDHVVEQHDRAACGTAGDEKSTGE
jgi:hypothetical protein